MAHMLHNPVRSYSEEETAQKLAFLNRIMQEVCKWQEDAFQQQKREFDKRAEEREFNVGDIVYVTRAKTGNMFQKFQPPYEGPFVLIQTLGHNNVRIEDCLNATRVKTVHINNLKIGNFREQVYD
jgi:hypothetical protein